jgi:hypothetical protein
MEIYIAYFDYLTKVNNKIEKTVHKSQLKENGCGVGDGVKPQLK